VHPVTGAIIGVLTVWALLATLVAVVLGQSIREADRRGRGAVTPVDRWKDRPYPPPGMPLRGPSAPSGESRAR
jgi:hypothetical protein